MSPPPLPERDIARRIENRVLKIHGLVLCGLGLAMTAQVLVGRLAGFGVFSFLRAQPMASIGLFEAFLLASLLGVFLLAASSLSHTSPWNFLGAGAHAILGITNLAHWRFYATIDAEVPGAIATIFHFAVIGVEVWAGLRNRAGRED